MPASGEQQHDGDGDAYLRGRDHEDQQHERAPGDRVATLRENHEKIGSWHHLYLARGKDHAGNVYGDPTKAYPELARFRAKHGKNGH